MTPGESSQHPSDTDQRPIAHPATFQDVPTSTISVDDSFQRRRGASPFVMAETEVTSEPSSPDIAATPRAAPQSARPAATPRAAPHSLDSAAMPSAAPKDRKRSVVLIAAVVVVVGLVANAVLLYFWTRPGTESASSQGRQPDQATEKRSTAVATSGPADVRQLHTPPRALADAEADPEEVAASQTPGEISLRLVTIPPGASISVDGQDIGSSPTTIQVTGPMEIEIKRRGYKPHQLTMNVEDARLVPGGILGIRLEQVPQRGKFRRLVKEGLAKQAANKHDEAIALFNQALKIVPDATVKYHKAHSLRIRGDLWQALKIYRRIRRHPRVSLYRQDIEENIATINAYYRFTPVRITTRPSRAEVTIDKKPVGKTPFTSRLVQGKHTVTVRRKGYQPLSTVIDVKGPKAVKLKLKLERAQ